MCTIHAPFVPDNIVIENSTQLQDMNSCVACFCALEGIIFESSLLIREGLSCFQKEDHAMVDSRE